MGNLSALLPLLVFMGVMIGIGFYVRKEGSRSGTGFVKNYFIGNHNLGGFVLAMTTVATYSSVSSFVGGPGMACFLIEMHSHLSFFSSHHRQQA